MKQQVGFLTLAVGLCVSIGLQLSAFSEVNLLQNGDFSLGPSVGGFVTLQNGETALPGWVITRANVDYIGNYFNGPDGKRSIDLDGSPGAGGVRQTFATTPGEWYEVRFQMAANNHGSPETKVMGVSAAGQTDRFEHPNTLNWTPKTWMFQAKESQTTLEFYSLDKGTGLYYGPLLADVSVKQSLAGNENGYQSVQGFKGTQKSKTTNASGKTKNLQSATGFNGTWDTNWGLVNLTVKGRQVTGGYHHKNGRIAGYLSPDGKTIRGTWAQEPTYKGNRDSGKFVFNLSNDRKRFTGTWGYGQAFGPDSWTGTRQINQATALASNSASSEDHAASQKFKACFVNSGSVASAGPCAGVPGSSVWIEMSRAIPNPPYQLVFKDVLTAGVPAAVSSQLSGSGKYFSTPAPKALCAGGSGSQWDIYLQDATGQSWGNIGRYTIDCR